MRRRRLIATLATVAGAVLAGDVATLVARSGRSPPVAAPTPLGTGSTTHPPSPSASASPSASPSPSPWPTPSSTPARSLAVIPRAAWGAAPPARAHASHTIERVTVHHTAVVMTDARDAPARMRAHQRHHLDSGFADLAYHFIVDVAGNVYEGRPLSAPGETFTDYDPTGHFLATAEGNFDEQQPTPAQLGALTDVLAWGCVEYGLDPTSIAGHDDVAATRCPGAALRVLVDDGTLAAAVSRALTSGGVELVVLGEEEGRARVAAIEAGG